MMAKTYNYTDDSQTWVREIDDDTYRFFPPEDLPEGVTPDDYADPRTPQFIYDQDVLAPTDAAMLSPRLIEELYDWAANGVALPDASKAKFGPLVAARKTKRAARSA